MNNCPVAHVNNIVNPSANDQTSEEDTEASDDGIDGIDGAFHRTHDSFKQDQKWTLPSGVVVEDVLFDVYCQSRSPSVTTSIRNWILDLGNPEIQERFSESDWEAIMAEMPPLPELDPLFVQSLLRFDGVHVTTHLLLGQC